MGFRGCCRLDFLGSGPSEAPMMPQHCAASHVSVWHRRHCAGSLISWPASKEVRTPIDSVRHRPLYVRGPNPEVFHAAISLRLVTAF